MFSYSPFYVIPYTVTHNRRARVVHILQEQVYTSELAVCSGQICPEGWNAHEFVNSCVNSWQTASITTITATLGPVPMLHGSNTFHDPPCI